MINSVMKTFSLSLLTVAAGAALATEQVRSTPPALMAVESFRSASLSSAEIARGWEAQQRHLDRRLAARGIQGIEIPGTILSPPLPDFELNRAEGSTSISTTRTARKAARPAHRPAPASAVNERL